MRNGHTRSRRTCCIQPLPMTAFTSSGKTGIACGPGLHGMLRRGVGVRGNGISSGMRRELDRARQLGKPILRSPEGVSNGLGSTAHQGISGGRRHGGSGLDDQYNPNSISDEKSTDYLDDQDPRHGHPRFSTSPGEPRGSPSRLSCSRGRSNRRSTGSARYNIRNTPEPCSRTRRTCCSFSAISTQA